MTDQCRCHDCSVYNRASISGMTYYRQISWSLEAARFDIVMIVSLWNFTDISAALYFRAIGKVLIQIPRLRDFTRSWRVQKSSTPTDFRAGHIRVHLQAVELSNQPWSCLQIITFSNDKMSYITQRTFFNIRAAGRRARSARRPAVQNVSVIAQGHGGGHASPIEAAGQWFY